MTEGRSRLGEIHGSKAWFLRQKLQIFVESTWPGGFYSSPSLTDRLDGIAISAAWTTLLATVGYQSITQISLSNTFCYGFESVLI